AAAADTVWFDDELPDGASALGSEPWTWVGNDPPPHSGAVAHQSTLAAGVHDHGFNFAYPDGQLQVNAGDILFTYVYLDPANPPEEIMLGFNTTEAQNSWEHRAYWGANAIHYGTDGTAGRTNLGALPPAGQWVRLEIPASKVGLEGLTLQGMGFVLYASGDSRATWDATGKSGGSGGGPSAPPPGNVDYLRIPQPGDHGLNILTPTLLEMVRINSKQPNPARVDSWDWVDGSGNFVAPEAARIEVRVGGQPVPFSVAGFKRRPVSAPLWKFDVRIANHLYLQLNDAIFTGQPVQVVNDGTLWPASMEFSATADALRHSPAIHVNQEGYVPSLPKHAMIGYYAGNLGELALPSTSFSLVDASNGATVYQGTLTLRPDVGYNYTPTPYQNVYQADFSGFTTPGEYRLVVPGVGASLPFLIHDGVALAFARTYALGLLEQRSGFNVAMPFTRFTHGADHTVPALIPTNDAPPFVFTWRTISNYASEVNPDNPPQIAPRLTSPSAQLFPFQNQGSVDTAGGHFEAANYSKVAYNSAQVVHVLMFAVDALPGVAALDNLGIPESGDGISDVLQEAKWEADFLAKMQDADGGFYYVVYPINREYEYDVLPENGDQEVVWPKNTVSTAAAVAALAQCASSPHFQEQFPQTAAMYLQKAQLGWNFLTDAVARFGKDGAYQRVMHFGDHFADRDELAWAACEMFLATGDPSYHETLKAWFPEPADPGTFRWGWWRLYGTYGNAVRSYAFAARSGRLAEGQLDAAYLAKCASVVVASGNDHLQWSQNNAYGSSFPELTKAYRAAGWYFSSVQAFDLVAAYQLDARPEVLDAILCNVNYEGGCNPVNVTYVTGLGWKRQRQIVDQYSANDRRVLPKIGVPIGNIQSGFVWTGTYGGELTALCFPFDYADSAPYPFYDRWCDFWNVSTEASTTDTVRSAAVTTWLAAQTPLAGQPWRSTNASIITPITGAQFGQPVTVRLQVADPDLSGARIVWEARDQEPVFGSLEYRFTPMLNDGPHWIEAEVQWPDGRRACATATVTVTATNLVWFDDALPEGAFGSGDGGDSWNWVSENPAPYSGTRAHQSANASGIHSHGFSGATHTLTLNTGDILVTYVYLDPANPPREIMLGWLDGESWEHRAYWGENLIPYGADGTPGKAYLGALPPAGQWVRLEVPASQVGLEGKTLFGMSFVLYDGKATWDHVARARPQRYEVRRPASSGGEFAARR
ncbi:MAG: glycoside hydrolase family 9 protein, partial [Verrucomicrobiota bacterium]